MGGEVVIFEDCPRSGVVGGIGGAMVKIVKEKAGKIVKEKVARLSRRKLLARLCEGEEVLARRGLAILYPLFLALAVETS